MGCCGSGWQGPNPQLANVLGASRNQAALMHLALDTSTTWTSIALVDDHEVVSLDEVEEEPGEDLVARIDVLMRRSGITRTQVDGIVVGGWTGAVHVDPGGVAVARHSGSRTWRQRCRSVLARRGGSRDCGAVGSARHWGLCCRDRCPPPGDLLGALRL